MLNQLGLFLFEGAPIEWGVALAYFAAALAFIPAGIGSAISLAKTGQAMAGVVSEKPELYSKCQLIQLLPATQGLYGFLIGFLTLVKIGALSGQVATVTVEVGLQLIAGALPVACLGMYSAIKQAQMGCSAIIMIGKRPEMSGKGILMTAVIELYAIFGFIVSFFVVMIGVSV